MRLKKRKLSYSYQKKLHTSWGLLLLLTFLVSCNPAEVSKSGSRSSSAAGAGSNAALVFRDNPIITAGPNYSEPVNISQFISGRAEFITAKSQLKSDCTLAFESNMVFPNYGVNTMVTKTESDCVDSRSTKAPGEVSLVKPANGSWSFTTGSDQFYQVNTMYHINLAKDKFISKIGRVMNRMHTSYFTNPQAQIANQQKQLPLYLKDSSLFWFKAITPTLDNYFKYNFLTSFSSCAIDKNATFSPAGPELCFGLDATKPTFKFAQDPTVIYHELAHGFVSLMMNYRNGTAAGSFTTLRSNLGSLAYDEAGAINEGIADYFSYVANKRTHFGEWALGRFYKASRPMSENDPIHIAGISATSEGRLSYPQFLHYDPNFPTAPLEGVHYAGQIASHYLVALTEELKTSCYPNATDDEQHEAATDIVVGIMAETLSEIGDLRSIGIDSSFGLPITSRFNSNSENIYSNNLDPQSAFVWTHVVNPTNYRRFFQLFAKNILKMKLVYPECVSFDINRSEKLLDDYGLLLFRTYNNDLDCTTYDNSSPLCPLPAGNSGLSRNLTSVSTSNRRKTVLVSKSLISLANETNRPNAYIVDNKASINAILANLLFKGVPIQVTTGVAGTEYNNGNTKISPGEIVGVIPNILNNSNSTIAGVQVLANDWDHVKVQDTTTGNFRPCALSGDDLSLDQGASNCSGVNASNLKTYKKLVKGASTSYPLEAVAPVCMVQLEEAGQTRWVSQNEFRKKNGQNIADKECLGYSSNAISTNEDLAFNPHSCLIRILPGAEQAVMSKIDSQKTFAETIRGTSTAAPKFNSSAAVLMEVSKWVPPGTKFRCRFRVRFTNCDDCYHDSSKANDDYLDYEYNGAKPYKLLNFEFEVTD